MIVLASGSPRRREILTAAGIPFEVRKPAVPEIRSEGEAPVEYVRRLALAKAAAVAAGSPDRIVLGADTVVVLDEHVLEKPSGPADAARMLRLLSGRMHSVITGICLHARGRAVLDSAETKVWFIDLSEQEIAGYVASGEPMDKAGAYAIQGLASKFIHRIEGCYFNVMGLPAALVYRQLEELCRKDSW